MKPGHIAIRMLGVLLLIGLPAVRVYLSWRIDQDTSYLRLADDASTPALKGQYLRQFLADMDRKSLPAHGAWVFTTPRNSVAEQQRVVLSLARRCEDLSNVDPASLGYAQGMNQVTGQEFKHVLDEVNGIYRTALWVHLGWWAWCVQWGVFISVPLGLVLTVRGVGPFKLPRLTKAPGGGPPVTLVGIFVALFVLSIFVSALRLPGC